jgi:hypothetical protein
LLLNDAMCVQAAENNACGRIYIEVRVSLCRFFNRLLGTCRVAGLLCASAALLVLTGCPRQNSAQPLKQVELRAPEGQPMMLAAYQAWFGKPNHINVGYSSLDRVTLDHQIDEAKNLGIRGFAVNWYGTGRDAGKDLEDRSYALLQSLAAEKDFHTAIMYDESEDPVHATDESIRDLTYAWEHYISPQAAASSAYLTYRDRPVIFIFQKSGKTDWKRVRAAMESWSPKPLLLYKDVAPSKADVMDGFYAWVHPDHGWSSDGKDWGEGYLNDFYSKMSSRYPDKLAVGAAWPGFNDSKASWSRNRRIDARCGKTFDDSLRVFRRYYNDSHPLPFLLIVTWNDYEEGTAIERGIPHC